ncbi:MAG: hypothetical protein NVS3B18_14190 [Candidatus Dormibacteria bacterium]
MVGDIFQPTHLLFILVVALLVLGPKRLPEVAKTLGKGIRDFRGAISGDSDHPNPVSSYLSGDLSSDHDEAATPAPTGETPAPVSETPAPPPAAPAPTPAETAPPLPAAGTPATPVPASAPATTAPPAVADPQPASPVDEPVQPIATPATTQPAPADDAAPQVHPAAPSAEQHE